MYLLSKLEIFTKYDSKFISQARRLLIWFWTESESCLTNVLDCKASSFSTHLEVELDLDLHHF